VKQPARVIAMAAAAVILAGCSAGVIPGTGDRPTPAVSPRPTAAALPGKYVGVAGDAAAFTAATGVIPDVSEQYEEFGGGFTPPARASVLSLINIESTSDPAEVTAGADDSWLRWLGRAIKAYGRPVAVSVDPEANGPWYGYGTTKATHAQYVALYRHVHNVIEQAGARNVIWTWTISNSPPITHPSLLRQLYPGDAYVQWIAVDGYFVGHENSFAQVFTRVFGEVRTFTKRPFIIAETSVQRGPSAASWVRELLAGVKADKDVLGFVWFNYDKAAELRDDWRIQDDPAALAAFRAGIQEFGAH
jgi:mannan endo-1,4-beta-mannosidase